MLVSHSKPSSCPNLPWGKKQEVESREVKGKWMPGKAACTNRPSFRETEGGG